MVERPEAPFEASGAAAVRRVDILLGEHVVAAGVAVDGVRRLSGSEVELSLDTARLRSQRWLAACGWVVGAVRSDGPSVPFFFSKSRSMPTASAEDERRSEGT